jgi:hypothetical protein
MPLYSSICYQKTPNAMKSHLSLLAAAVLLIATTTTIGAIALDQTTVTFSGGHIDSSPFGLVDVREFEQAQTVTTGISGYLSQVDVWVGKQADASIEFTLTIYSVGDTPNNSSELASFPIPANSIGSTDLFNFSKVSIDTRSADLFFNSGDTFSIALSAPDEPISGVAPVWAPYSWANANLLSYAGGSRYYREIQNGPTWSQTSFTDHALSTWVETTPESTFTGLGHLSQQTKPSQRNM